MISEKLLMSYQRLVSLIKLLHLYREKYIIIIIIYQYIFLHQTFSIFEVLIQTLIFLLQCFNSFGIYNYGYDIKFDGKMTSFQHIYHIFLVSFLALSVYNITVFFVCFSPQLAFKMYLGIQPVVSNWSAAGDEFSLLIENNPLTDFVELPPGHSQLNFSNIVCGVLKAALEMVSIGAPMNPSTLVQNVLH